MNGNVAKIHEGLYVGSESTMYRPLREQELAAHRERFGIPPLASQQQRVEQQLGPATHPPFDAQRRGPCFGIALVRHRDGVQSNERAGKVLREQRPLGDPKDVGGSRA